MKTILVSKQHYRRILKALAFYADPNNWNGLHDSRCIFKYGDGPWTRGIQYPTPTREDEGALARKILRVRPKSRYAGEPVLYLRDVNSPALRRKA